MFICRGPAGDPVGVLLHTFGFIVYAVLSRMKGPTCDDVSDATSCRPLIYDLDLNLHNRVEPTRHVRCTVATTHVATHRFQS